MWRESVRYFSSGEFLRIGRWLPSFGLAQPISFLQAPCPPSRTPRTEHQNFLTQPPKAHPANINFTQRFGSSLALNIHFNALVLDGVYTTDGPDSIPVFHPAPP
ncbi:MAG: hypothetical protein ACI9X4_001697, partial [Glaciecola sp.]